MTTITQPNAQTLLEFANLQVASEAFLLPLNTPPEDPKEHIPTEIVLKTKILTDGNNHSTKFTQTMAEDFAKNWKVVDHISNTKTGFSGTLFEAINDIPGTDIKAVQQVISFRSTEFVEDAVHDNKMTNTLEIKEKGFAFGQIADMRSWVLDLIGEGLLHSDIKVTGYSLGGHVATAFNMLQQEGAFGSYFDISNTFTFNGAGVGRVAEGHTLTELITEFTAGRKSSHEDSKRREN